MAEIKNPRILGTITLILISVILCPISHGKIIYVDDDAIGANNGSSWENAYTFLQEALAYTNTTDKPVEIWVAQGIYRPNEGLIAILEFDWRTTTFQLINDVTLKGGYAGVGRPDPNDRNITLPVTLNLAGEWFLGGSDIQDNHTWDGLITINSSGVVTGGTLSSSEGPVYSFTGGDLAIDATGRVTGTLRDSDGVTTELTLQMNHSNSIMAGEGNTRIDNEDGVFIFIKKTSGFAAENLAGEWFLGSSDIQGDHTWDGLITINRSGVVIGGTLSSSEGPVYQFIGGELAIDSTGKVTGTVTDSDGITTRLTMQMDVAKSIMAGEGNATTSQEDGVFILIKKSSGFTAGNLTGEWSLGGSDIQGHHTWDGLVTIDSTGAITGGTLASSEGPVYQFTGGELAIDEIGKVTGTLTDSDGVTTHYTMQMDMNKNIMAGEANARAEYEDGVFVFVRKASGYQTVLSGDLNGNDGLNFTGNSENSYHVVTGSGTDNTAALDGFVITASNANTGTFPDPRCIGGGMYNFAGSPKLSNCIFRNNSAFSGGAGMYNSENSDPSLENCSFIENVTDEDGAGMLNFMGSDPVLTGCDFIRNRAEDHAGGMLNVAESNPVLNRCMFIANSAGAESQRHDGGGMFNDGGSPTLRHCLFISNAAGRNGGAMHNREMSNPIMLNCTFSENQSGSEGGGIHIQDANATLTNCILWANSSDQINGDANVSYSNVEGGFAGDGNINTDPLFADANNGDYHLKSETGRWDPNSESWIKDDLTSPCIDAGDPNSDWSGETWPHGGRINMGAYGGTRQASMSPETEGMMLPRVAYIFSHKNEVAESFESFLGAYGCSTTLINLNDVSAAPLDSYDLLIVANDTQNPDIWSDPETVAAIEDSNKPAIGLGEGGYTFFGELGLAIGYPNGMHGSRNNIEVIDPNCSLFRTPYSIEIPQDRALRLYTETDHVTINLWPMPDTVTALASEVNNSGYYPLVTEYNRYLFWGFTESPEKMTEIGKTLFINVVIWTANKAWESKL